jgi:chorismate-pyruvate lyase
MVVLAALAVATWLYGRMPATATRTLLAEGAQPLGYYLRAARILGTAESPTGSWPTTSKNCRRSSA